MIITQDWKTLSTQPSLTDSFKEAKQNAEQLLKKVGLANETGKKTGNTRAECARDLDWLMY